MAEARKMYSTRLPLGTVAKIERLTARLQSRQAVGKVSQADLLVWLVDRAEAEMEVADAAVPEPVEPEVAPAAPKPAPRKRAVAGRGGAISQEIDRGEAQATRTVPVQVRHETIRIPVPYVLHETKP